VKDIQRHLLEKDVFKKLPLNELTRLADYGLLRKLSTGDYLCRQGENWPYVLFLVSGQLRWSMLSSGGKSHQLFTINTGEVFWAHSMFDDKPMPASLNAVQKLEVYVWPRDEILPVLKKYPEAMWEITKKLTGIMREAREIIYGLAFQPVAARLAGLLLNSLDEPDHDSLEREMTLEEMASVLATSPEVVCRLLYQLQTDGILRITRTQIKFEDRDALLKLKTLT